MVFNSLIFFAFFGVALLLNHRFISWRIRKINLLVLSYLFYAAWEPAYVLILVASTVVDHFVVKRMIRTESQPKKRRLLIVSLTVNLGMLGYFKYAAFLTETLNAVVGFAGLEFAAPVPNILLPVGISFYTFQTLSYSIDVYRGTFKGAKSFLDFALFVSFFPQLVAGPIVRATDFLPQCESPREIAKGQFSWGLTLLVLGLFQKIILADILLSPVVSQIFNASADATFAQAWLGSAVFAVQLYFDFAGYSTCAIGVALCLGFELPINFRAPFASRGFADFWQRWHISLSTWIRDYLYMPILLGYRHRPKIAPYLAILVTMLLSGLWHGAAWRFAFYGGLHAVYLLIDYVVRTTFAKRWKKRNKGKKGKKKRKPPVLVTALAIAVTFLGFCVTCIFFRAQSFESAFQLLEAMFWVGSGAGVDLRSQLVEVALAIVAITLIYQWTFASSDFKSVAMRVPWWGRSALVALMITAIAITLPAMEERFVFVYFQF